MLEVLEALQDPEVIHYVVLSMLEAVESRFCFLEAMRRVLFFMLEALEVLEMLGVLEVLDA